SCAPTVCGRSGAVFGPRSCAPRLGQDGRSALRPRFGSLPCRAAMGDMVRDVIVVGAGPVGLLMAAELARHGVDVEVLERHQRPMPGTRAIGVHPPVLAALEPSGMTDRLL